MKKILDACCGSRMFWFDKKHKNTVFMDIRQTSEILCDGRKLEVNPDVLGDFKDMPFEDESFHLVIFDPPHLVKAGDNSWLAKKYGKLDLATWPNDIKQGFDECMRVLKPNGTLIFKWNEEQIKLKEILKAIGSEPLIGNRRSKTHWLVFMKEEEE
ncbi:class I SAM-dependent methyltransferase [Carnobacterium divergens]|uniref:class I SAM-dependent methyltransferase n=1 Tax=Carnobacterium divergens TaxID=2748 RepID=UPI0028903769|nr:class I SAM-dependent methyltransferase [Carnobacterium divergens]MDT1996836.1 class I SAM-dependent methyltransferase [Carnobacterium divergens]